MPEVSRLHGTRKFSDWTLHAAHSAVTNSAVTKSAVAPSEHGVMWWRPRSRQLHSAARSRRLRGRALILLWCLVRSVWSSWFAVLSTPSASCS